MSQHRYKVGQHVDYSPGRVGVPASAAKYIIVKLLPFENGEPQYRIKASTENFERVAKESQLTRRV